MTARARREGALFDSRTANVLTISNRRPIGDTRMNTNRQITWLRRFPLLAAWPAVALLAALPAPAAVTIGSVSEIDRAKPPGVPYGVGEEITIVVELLGEGGAAAVITGVTPSASGGMPRLRLTTEKAGFNTGDARYYAHYREYYENFIFFTYIVNSGDFTPDLDTDRFDRNGATITTSAGNVDYATGASLPAPGTPGSLSYTSDIAIRTILFRGQPDPARMTLTVQELASGILPLTRSAEGDLNIDFVVTAIPADAKDTVLNWTPDPFSIASRAAEANLTVNGLAQGNAVLQLHPTSYSTTNGDLFATVNVVVGTPRQFTIATAVSELAEGQNTTCTVTLSDPAPAGGLAVTLTNNPAHLLAYPAGNVVSFLAGERSKGTVVKGLDGDTSVYIGGFSSKPGYQLLAGVTLSITNTAPRIVSPATPWTPLPGTVNVPYAFAWSVTDVPADTNSVQVKIDFGDGADSGWIDGLAGTLSHTYTAIGTYNVTITARDQEGGTASLPGTLEIQATPPSPSFTIVGPPTPVPENNGLGGGTITLTRPAPAGGLTITLSDGGSPALDFVGSPAIYFPAGTIDGTFQVVGLDGPAVVTITGVCSDPAFTMSQPGTVTVDNIDPILNQPPDPWTPAPGAEGFPYTFSWSATDVPADLPKLQVQVYFGDGAVSGWINGTDGSVNHTYTTPGSYNVTIVVRDTDGGTDSVTGLLEIEPAVQVIVNEYKYNSPNSYKGLSGLGRGTIDDTDPLTTRTAMAGDYAWIIRYMPAQGSTLLVATPENATIDNVTYNSFFHVWLGEGFTSQQVLDPIAPDTAQLLLGGADRQVGGVFSREYYPEDNCGDIDHDELPDLWEELYQPAGLNNEAPDRMGNPDGDLLPLRCNANLAYPIGDGADRYAPLGPAFGNVLEVRGLHPGLNASFSDPSGPADEPGAPLATAGWPGTDPTNPDTDGDGRPDGWEYYFWMNAAVRGITGEAYDPTRITEGTTISSATIAAAFNPLVEGAPDADTDGDGISDIEEMSLGTNPIHWDTDGDGMCDGWEIMRGLDPFGDDADMNDDGDWMAMADALRHFEVYHAYGYDPRTAWWKHYIEKDRARTFFQPNTVEYTAYQEYAVMRFWIEQGVVASVAATPKAWSAWSTDPFSADTDGDGKPDGWELYIAKDPLSGYIGFSPSRPDFDDNTPDYDGDKLANLAECHGQEICQRYGIGNVNDRWWNKFWPTDPWNADTDGDLLPDGYERRVFQYDDPVLTGYSRGCRPGGMLNPCCVDTDMDYLPDYFEYEFAGTFDAATGDIHNGMDGTYFDSKSGPDTRLGGARRNCDFDFDGLENYQEYWVNAVYHFNYSYWSPGRGLGGYDPADFFYGVPHPWDWATLANYWQNEEYPNVPYFFIPPEPRPLVLHYAACDPAYPDTDEDGMDDYHEMFHALNPLWSLTRDVVNQLPPSPVYDFRLQPWLVGEQTADPDMDGLVNYEEALTPNHPEPRNHHTDPSPLWMTDISYDQSWANLYYIPGSIPMYWTTNQLTLFPEPDLMGMPPAFMFSFEVNEGYDTDNDNIQDKQELIAAALGLTDPLDGDSPRRRKALYLPGDGAARTRIGFAHGPDALRSWTIEAWVRPLNPAAGRRQIILERPVQFWESDPMPATSYVRRNFRLGLEWDGAPFVEYDDTGKGVLTPRAVARDWPLVSTNWIHLAATMNGVEGLLTLYIDGQQAVSVPTTAIPCNGFIDSDPALNVYVRAPLLIGASDSNPAGEVNGANYYVNGSIPGRPMQPQLTDFFTGWVDEVRIWDGARSHSEIFADLVARKRYGLADVIAGREESVARLQSLLASRGLSLSPYNYSFDGYFTAAAQVLVRTGGENATVRLPPTLLYHYSFDNLPDPKWEQVVPNSFDTLTGRPLDGSYPGVPWWARAADRSTVYRTYDANPYLFVHWIENTVATLPCGLLDSNGLFRATHALDSRYWTRYATGGVPLPPPFENDFNNSANPYGFTYTHGDCAINEIHPEFTTFARFDPLVSTLYNHALPLRGAVADADVPLWDNGTPGRADFDSDGDGIPDWWEYAHGLDPFDPADRYLDPDRDGLPNYAEWLAGTNPLSPDSDGDGINDYEDTSAGSARMNGVRFTDNDHVEDQWEDRFDEAFASPYRYDEHWDRDGDGWDNWSEARAGTRPDDAASLPVPALLRLTLDYDGVRDIQVANPTLVVHAYTDPYMNGMPDAVFTRPLTSPVQWPLTLDLTPADLRLGHLRQGLNYFHAFIDLDGSQRDIIDPSIPWFTWTPGEPAAVADEQIYGTDVGWDRNEVRLVLRDEARSFARLSWESLLPAGDNQSHTIEIHPAAGGDMAFKRTFAAPRTWLHEGDIMAGKTAGFGLPAGGPGTKVYRWTLDGADAGFITNIYAATLPAPVAVYPKNDVLQGARPEFRWRMAPEATAFVFELWRDAVGTGTLMWQSGERLAIPRRRTDAATADLCIWRFPFHAGNVLPSGRLFANGTYYWRVKAVSPAVPAGGAWSDQPSFRLDVQTAPETSGGMGWCRVDVRYPGQTALSNGAPIRVQAFRSRSFNGIPDGEAQLAAPGVATLAGLLPGVYYIRAYVDQNNDRKRDAWESHGYLRDQHDIAEPFRVLGVEVTAYGLTPTVTLTIRDADTDNDKLPDCLEYIMHGAAGGDWLAKAGPGPISSSPPYSDYDGDGLNDLSELDAGTSVFLVDTDGDGINDLLDRDLGLNPAVADRLVISAAMPRNDGLRLSWRWTDDSGSGAPAPLGPPPAEQPAQLGREVTYSIEWKESLASPDDWRPLTNIVTRDAAGTVVIVPVAGSPSGFYRLRMFAE
jgi:PKD repeat protein